MQQQEILKAMITLEKTVGNLYQLYSTMFDNKDFWLSLYKEEYEHAKIIGDLYKKVNKEKVYFDDHRFKLEPINFSIQGIEEKIAKAKASQQIDLIAALANALNIEHSLLESGYYQIYQADSVELKAVLEAMRLGTEVHINKVQMELDKYKNLVSDN